MGHGHIDIILMSRNKIDAANYGKVHPEQNRRTQNERGLREVYQCPSDFAALGSVVDAPDQMVRMFCVVIKMSI
jgi:hypothetical protein